MFLFLIIYLYIHVNNLDAVVRTSLVGGFISQGVNSENRLLLKNIVTYGLWLPSDTSHKVTDQAKTWIHLGIVFLTLFLWGFYLPPWWMLQFFSTAHCCRASTGDIFSCSSFVHRFPSYLVLLRLPLYNNTCFSSLFLRFHMQCYFYTQ